MRAIFMVVLAAALLLTGASAYGEEQVGIVKATSGEVVIARSGRAIIAEPNMKLYEGDVVRTGPTGKTGLILGDDTVISMGLNSRLAVESFAFQPNERKLSLIVRVFQGTFSFLSGRIAKLAPGLMHIETPHATVGVRGTHVLIQVD